MEAFKKWELPARIAGYELLRRAIKQKKNIYFDHGGTPICHRELLCLKLSIISLKLMAGEKKYTNDTVSNCYRIDIAYSLGNKTDSV